MTSPTYGAQVKYLWVFKTCGTFTEGKCHKFDNVKRAIQQFKSRAEMTTYRCALIFLSVFTKSQQTLSNIDEE